MKTHYCLTNKVKALLLRCFLFGIFFINVFNTSAQHFITVGTGNPYLPMNIIIDSAFSNGSLLQAGDEIAVFDVNGSGNEICVGQVSITNTFTSDTNYIINATADDPTTPEQDGFMVGDSIIFRYWDNSSNKEIILLNSVFNPALDSTYQLQGTASTGLTGFSYETWTGEVDTVWNNKNNWNFNRIPTLQFDVVIPASPVGNRFPSVIIQSAITNNITVEDSAIITIYGKLTVGYSGSPY